MGLFELTKKDINKAPMLITFEYTTYMVAQPSRVWSQIIRLSRLTQWLIVLVNSAMILVLVGLMLWLTLATGLLSSVETVAGLLAMGLIVFPIIRNVIRLVRHMRGKPIVE